MNFTPLSDEQRQHFNEHGYLLVRDAIDPQTVTGLQNACDRFMETQPPYHNYYANRYIDMLYDPALIAVITNSRILPLVMELLSYDLHLMRTHLIYKYPQQESDTPIHPDGDGRSFRNWHRDLNNFAPDHPIRGTVAIRAGYALTDFTEPNSGVTLLVPGSHKLTQQLKFKKGALDPLDFVEPMVKAGDAYLFSTSTYHTPAVNFTDHVAKIALVSYAYRWWGQCHPRPDDTVLDTMDPMTAQLLGKAWEGDENPLKLWARENGIEVEDPPMRAYV